MSFDLIFCSPNKDGVNALSLFEYFRSRPNMKCTMKNDSFEVMYENQRTGVYCSFYYEPINNENDIPSDISEKGATGLSVSINYGRPSFFAHELMPLIVELCNFNNLLILDPQEEDGGSPKICVVSELIESWENINATMAIPAAIKSHFQPPFMDKEKALFLWKYMMISETLEKRLVTEDIFVPKMIVINRLPDIPLETAITWTNGIPTVLPQCDIVILQKIHSKGFFGIGRREEIGWIKYETVVESIRPYLNRFTIKKPSIYEVQVLFSKNSERVREILLELPLEGSLYSLEGVAMDGFIDYKIEGE